MTTQRDMLRNEAVKLIKNNAKGLRYSDLVIELRYIFPNIPIKSIPSAIWDLNVTRNKDIYKPSRGLFKYRFSNEEQISEIIEKPPLTLQEEDFYEPFADWLKVDLGECSEAVALGGNYLGKKWGTPDVIGVY